MKRFSAFVIFQRVSEFLLVSFAIISGFGLYYALIGLLFARSITFAITTIFIILEIDVVRPDMCTIWNYLSYSIYLVFVNICYWILNLGDRYIIGWFLGAASVGIYSAAFTVGSIISYLYSPLANILFPALAHSYNNYNEGISEIYLKYTLRIFLFVAIPCVFGLTVLSRQLLHILTTPAFEPYYYIIPLASIGGILYSIGNIYADTFNLLKMTKLLFTSYMISALINLSLNMLMVPRIGILGSGISYVASLIFLVILLHNVVNSHILIDWDYKFIIKSIVSSSIMALILLVLNPCNILTIVFSILLGFFIYLVIMILLRGLTNNEINFMVQLFNKSKLVYN